ncbi:hypothetical protein BFP71_13475 [Roseivirga misakiensis]|uniref:DUF349 domain-containing protein n=1 Tax=Roseivirga misakiensis TaxID=1563681 RepID=A0A1E5T2K3_9BACT|nr:hypothetical protein BFP71_13475 [Roseivirga misakiensis]
MAKAEPKAEVEEENTAATESSNDDTVESEETPKASEETETTEEESEPTEEDNFELPDYTTFSREELVEAIEGATQLNNFNHIDQIVSGTETLFKGMEDVIRKEAEERYIADGGTAEDFEFRHDSLFNRFDASLRQIRDRKSAYYKEREANKTRNLEKKQEILEQLRELVDGENPTTSIKPIKEIQEVWKAIGPVPSQQSKTLWANYNALLDRFYHNRHILFELKDLDRKKNHAAKIVLCEKAEALGAMDNVKDAVIQLNELHEEYKKVGAVPREVQEALWQRFKAASDVVYRKRKEFLEHLKGDLKENLVKKQELISQLAEFTSFTSDRINDWNAKTKEILNVQKSWEAIGGVPREKAKEMNRAFWSAFKGFFAKKNEFFKQLESLRKVNLEKKEELINEAIALQDSTEWDKTAEKLKQLQSRWKEVGPVPEKQRNAVYARFKEACDTFFNNKRKEHNLAEANYVENQEKKEAVLKEIAEKAGGEGASEQELMTLISTYNELGFVPRNAIKAMDAKFKEVVKSYIDGLKLDESEAETLLLKAELSGGGRGDGADRRLQKKEGALRRKINELEDNISLWNNNLAFFANSKTADKLKEEFDVKIETAEKEIQVLKKQLKVLRSI